MSQKMAVKQAQTQAQAQAVSEAQSTAVIKCVFSLFSNSFTLQLVSNVINLIFRNCVRLAVSTVAFARELFPKEAFVSKSYGGVNLEVLRPVDSKGTIVHEGALRIVRSKFVNNSTSTNITQSMNGLKKVPSRQWIRTTLKRSLSIFWMRIQTIRKLVFWRAIHSKSRQEVLMARD